MDDGSFNILTGTAYDAAPRLLGSILERRLEGRLIRVRIVETEAYDQSDVASHSYKGLSPRTAVMYGKPGRLYVYFTYGMHYCCNVVVGPPGHGAAVLIRAVEPLSGEDIMAFHRQARNSIELCNGPAKLCQALEIDKRLNGHDLTAEPLKLYISEPALDKNIAVSTRIGISRGIELPWRFYIRNNPYVSRK